MRYLPPRAQLRAASHSVVSVWLVSTSCLKVLALAAAITSARLPLFGLISA